MELNEEEKRQLFQVDGDCGQPMVRKTAVYKGKNGKRQTYSYFVCNGRP